MSARRSRKLKLAAYAGVVLFSGLVWFGVIVLGRTMMDKNQHDAAVNSTIHAPAPKTPEDPVAPTEARARDH